MNQNGEETGDVPENIPALKRTKNLTWLCVAVLFFAGAGYPEDSEANFASAFGEQKTGVENSYIVKHFDTMWDLSYTFYGNPFVWGCIWEANRSISDPHWIYPGDTLIIPDISKRLSSVKDTPANLENQTKVQNTDQSVENIINRQFQASGVSTKEQPAEESAWGIEENDVNAVYRKGYFREELLRRVPFLWTTPDVKNITLPGNALIEDNPEAPAFQQYTHVTCRVFGNQTCRVGDTVDIFHKMKFLKVNKKTRGLVKRVGFGIVEESNDRTMRIFLYKIWDLVRNDDRIEKKETLHTYSLGDIVSPQKLQGALVIERCETSGSPYLYQTFIIDRGSIDQIQMGDIFMVFPKVKKEFSPIPALIGIAMRVMEETTSMYIIKMFDSTLKSGDYAQLSKRVLLQ
jgi:hypothetical protein